MTHQFSGTKMAYPEFEVGHPLFQVLQGSEHFVSLRLPKGQLGKFDRSNAFPQETLTFSKKGIDMASKGKKRGTVPVAIYGSDNFDVEVVDLSSVKLAGAPCATRGQTNKMMASFEDLNYDGHEDLVMHFSVAGLNTYGDTIAVIAGKLNDGTLFYGADSINIVPDENLLKAGRRPLDLR